MSAYLRKGGVSGWVCSFRSLCCVSANYEFLQHQNQEAPAAHQANTLSVFSRTNTRKPSSLSRTAV